MVNPISQPGQAQNQIGQNNGISQSINYLSNVFNNIDGPNNNFQRERFGNFVSTILQELQNPGTNADQAITNLRNNYTTGDNGILGFVNPNERPTFTNHLERLIRAFKNNPATQGSITQGLVNNTPQGTVLQNINKLFSGLTPQQQQQLRPLIRTIASGIGGNREAANQWNNIIPQIDNISLNLGNELRNISSFPGNRAMTNAVVSGLNNIVGND